MHALALYLDGKEGADEIWVPRALLEALLEQDGPKIGVVKAKDLGDDWRAESHLKPFPPETAKTILKEMGEN